MEHAQAFAATAAQDTTRWVRTLREFSRPDHARSIFEIAVTAVPFVALWALMWASLQIGYWACLLLAIPAAGFLVRLFMIQHDCSHGSFFRVRPANEWVGRVIGIATLTPFGVWQRTHSIHHASSGNLDRRGIGDIDTLTVAEYLSRSRLGRLRYRLYRNPLVLFVIGPAYMFVLQHRLPIGLMTSGRAAWISTMGTNLAVAACVAGMVWLVGWAPFLLI